MKIITFLFICFSNVIAQSVDFYREDITFRLSDTKFQVDGIYYFYNNTDQKQKNLIYFPVKPICANNKIDSIQVINLSKMKVVSISQKTANGFIFVLEANAQDSTLYQIKYQQDICSDSAIYILKSTQKWGKPLVAGQYKLIVPNSIKINHSSYEPDKKYYFNDFYVYAWQERDFYPNRDMIFKFTNSTSD